MPPRDWPGEAADGAEAGAAGGAEAGEAERPVRGTASTTLRYRRTADAEDLDVIETLTVDVGDPERDRLTGHVLAYGNWDLDGRATKDGEDSDFRDLDDTYDSALVGRLYDAYVDVHDVDGLRELRLGRQSLVDAPIYALFDGGWVETAERGDERVSAGLFGGHSVHQFETALDGDSVFGAYLQARPWDAGRVRVDYMNLEDDARLFDREADLIALRLWQGLGAGSRFHVGHTRLDGQERDLTARVQWQAADGLDVQVQYYELLQTQGELAFELDPYSSLLFEQNPYRLWRLVVSKDIGDSLVLEAGASARRMSDEADEGEFNREYDEQHLTLSLVDLPGDGEVSLTGSQLDDSGTKVQALGADVSRDVGQDWRASLGTYYALYEIDLFQQRERDHSRVWYARAKRALGEAFTLDLRVEYETDEFDDYLVTRVGTRWSF